MPVADIVALEVLLLLHIPPAVASLNDVVDAAQTELPPAIAGSEATVKKEAQPPPMEYDIFAVPADTP